jgi:vitamin B12 transporter
MKHRLPPGRTAVRCLVIGSALLWAGPVFSQSDPDNELDAVVVVATRTPEDVRTLGSSVDLMTPQDLSRMQVTSFAEALGAIPGAPALANGAPGSDVSLFMRGANSDQILFMVDGIRLNDANTDYAVFLGGARIGAADSIEIARGPQSTLYGSEAVGGVVSIQAQKGSGDPTADATVEAGSFDTVAGTLDCQGARDKWAWSFSASGSHTENDRPNNAFDSGDLVFRIDRDISPSVDLGATLRGFEGRYGDPGDIYTNDPYAYETEANWLGTVFADLRPSPDLTARITVGGQDRRYVSFDEDPGVFTDTTVVQNRRGVFDVQSTYSGLAGQRLTAGASAEAETTQDDGYGDIDQRQTFVAAFAEDEWHPLDSTYLTGGFRYDDFDTFGTARHGARDGRLAYAGPLAQGARKLRDRVQRAELPRALRGLHGLCGEPRPETREHSGRDAGLDWYLPRNRGVLSATWFWNSYTNLIDYNFDVYPGHHREYRPGPHPRDRT